MIVATATWSVWVHGASFVMIWSAPMIDCTTMSPSAAASRRRTEGRLAASRRTIHAAAARMRKTIAVAYPAMDVLLLVVAAELVFHPIGKNFGHKLLIASIAMLVIGDEISYVVANESTASNGGIADLFWLLAAYRPERPPELTQMFNDLAWVSFTGQVGFLIAQCVFLALAMQSIKMSGRLGIVSIVAELDSVVGQQLTLARFEHTQKARSASHSADALTDFNPCALVHRFNSGGGDLRGDLVI